jgi:protein-S-isoprenylcysteine O-methyltransferase Ste14
MTEIDYAILAGWWIAWCGLHSGLIAPPVTEWFRRRLGEGFRFYRLAYNLVAVATFVTLVRYGPGGCSPVLFRWGGALVWLQAALCGSAVALFLAGARSYSMRRFLGWEQLKRGGHPRSLAEGGRLQTNGILQAVRHPWYLAALLLIWAAGDVTAANLVVKGILSIYLSAGAWLEERKLVAVHGDAYCRYRDQVSMLVPFKYLARKLGRRPPQSGV